MILWRNSMKLNQVVIPPLLNVCNWYNEYDNAWIERQTITTANETFSKPPGDSLIRVQRF